MSFTDKVVIVTGASSGIGAAIATKYASEGANVVIVGRNEEKLQKVAQTIQLNDGKCLVIKADLSKDEELKPIVPKTIEQYGKIDILINNAGMTKLGSLENGKLVEAYDAVMATNLRAAVHLTSLATPHLLATKGNIINISSVGGSYVPHSLYTAYAISKAGLDHFTRCIALELAPFGVRVNCVKPGPVLTDIVDNSGYKGAQAEFVWNGFKAGTALNRIAESEEIANLVLFVTSEKSKSVTGSILLADNGWLLKN